MPRDLRTYLEEYRKAHPDQVIEVDREIDSAQEVTALVNKVERQRKYPIFLFNNVRSKNGKTEHRLVTNLFASHERASEMIGSSSRAVAKEYYEKSRVTKTKPELVRRSEAPVKEVVRTGAEANLHDYPAIVHNFMDPGPYFSAGFLTTIHPDTGIDNTALQRGWMKGPREVRIWMFRETHNAHNFKAYTDRGEDMPCAYWVGHHPVAMLGGQARLGYPESHYEAMGGLLGEPLRVVPSETLGEDFLVPADAEFVVEGYMKRGVLVPEGPFGEYPGYTGPQWPGTLMEVTAITHRRDGIWHTMIAGYSDHQVMGSLAIEAALYEDLRKIAPSVQNVHMALSGACRFHAYVQVKDPRPGDPKEIILRALTVDYRIKHVFVVDDDIDIYNDSEVLFAVATRTMWDRDVVIQPGMRGYDIDPMVDGLFSTKGGIDATKPAGHPFSERNRPSPEAVAKIRVEDYLDPDQLARIPIEQQ